MVSLPLTSETANRGEQALDRASSKETKHILSPIFLALRKWLNALLSVIAIAMTGQCFAETTASDGWPVLGLPSPIIAIREINGSWRPIESNLLIGVRRTPDLLRFEPGLEQLDIIVDTRHAKLQLPASCRQRFILPWQNASEQDARSVQLFNFANYGAEVASTLVIHGSGCHVELSLGGKSEKYERDFGAAFFGNLVPQPQIRDYGQPLGRAITAKFGHIKIGNGMDEIQANFLMEHIELNLDTPLPSRAKDLAWVLIGGALATFFWGLVFGRTGSGLIRSIGALFFPATWRFGGMGLRMWWLATFSRAGPGSPIATVREARFKPHLTSKLERMEGANSLPVVIVYVSGTWANQASEENLRDYAANVSAGLPATSYLYWWSGLNDELSRFQAAETLAEKLLEDLQVKSAQLIILVGFSHGGTVARHTAERFNSSGLNMKVVQLASPNFDTQLSVRPEAIQNYFRKGSALFWTIPIAMALFVIGMLVNNGTISFLLAFPSTLLLILGAGTGFFAWSGRAGERKRAYEERLRPYLALSRKPIELTRVAFQRDLVIKLFKALKPIVKARKELEGALESSSPLELPHSSNQKYVYLVPLQILTYFSLVVLLTTHVEAPPSILVFLFSGVAALFASFFYYAVFERSSNASNDRPRLGAIFYAIGLRRVAPLLGLPRLYPSNYLFDIDDRIDVTVPEPIGNFDSFTNWHGMMLSSPEARAAVKQWILLTIRKASSS